MGFSFSDWGIIRFPKTLKSKNEKINMSFQLSKATSRKNENGGYDTVYENIQVIKFDVAESLAKRIVDRARAYIRGDMRMESYEKDGQTQYIMKVYADKIEMLDKGVDSANSGYADMGGTLF